MKRYTELSHAELISLADKQIEMLIELEIAHAAIEPVLPPIKPSLESAGIIASEIVFEVGNMIFKNEEDAKTVLAFNKYIKATGEIRQKVWGAVRDARDLENELELARQTYQKYLKLADNDKKVADNFFRNTYQNRQNFIEQIIIPDVVEKPE